MIGPARPQVGEHRRRPRDSPDQRAGGACPAGEDTARPDGSSCSRCASRRAAARPRRVRPAPRWGRAASPGVAPRPGAPRPVRSPGTRTAGDRCVRGRRSAAGSSGIRPSQRSIGSCGVNAWRGRVRHRSRPRSPRCNRRCEGARGQEAPGHRSCPTSRRSPAPCRTPAAGRDRPRRRRHRRGRRNAATSARAPSMTGPVLASRGRRRCAARSPLKALSRRTTGASASSERRQDSPVTEPATSCPRKPRLGR